MLSSVMPSGPFSGAVQFQPGRCVHCAAAHVRPHTVLARPAVFT